MGDQPPLSPRPLQWRPEHGRIQSAGERRRSQVLRDAFNVPRDPGTSCSVQREPPRWRRPKHRRRTPSLVQTVSAWGTHGRRKEDSAPPRTYQSASPNLKKRIASGAVRTRPKVPRPPPATSSLTTRVMRSNRPYSTRPELKLRKALRSAGVRDYRLTNRALPGRPDITIPAESIAIFVHGCFWHRCPRHGIRLPKTNRKYWETKFQLNVTRDRRKVRQLRAIGWRVFIAWECDIAADPARAAERILRRLGRSSLGERGG